eukprot:578735-Amorphochlora_amoeboformis.AAC.1
MIDGTLWFNRRWSRTHLRDLCVILVELYKAKKAKINQALTKEAAMFRQRAQVAELKVWEGMGF